MLYRQPGMHLVDAQRTQVPSFQGIVNWGNLANQPTFQLTVTGQKRLLAITNHFAVSGILTGSFLGFHHVRDELQTQIFLKLILFHLVSGQSVFRKVPLQLVTQMHFQTRPELDVAFSLTRINIITLQNITQHPDVLRAKVHNSSLPLTAAISAPVLIFVMRCSWAPSKKPVG